jgi:hypothetical protein
MCPYCGSKSACEHLVIRFRDSQQVSWLYTRNELGIDSYRPAPRMKLTNAIMTPLRQYCKTVPEALYATAWGRAYARREVATSYGSTGSR